MDQEEVFCLGYFYFLQNLEIEKIYFFIMSTIAKEKN